MIWEILLSDIDLIIFKNKKRRLLCLAIKKSISQTGTLSNYIPMFFFLNNYIATPLITIQRTIRFIKIHVSMKKNHKHQRNSNVMFYHYSSSSSSNSEGTQLQIHSPIILPEDRHLLDNAIWWSSLIFEGQRSQWLWKLVICPC